MTAASAAAPPTVASLPVSPRPLPGEALSSWIARVAARYDLGAAVFLRQVLRDDGVDPDTEEAGRQARRLDALPWPAAEMALAQATRLDRMEIRGLRAARHRATGAGVWPRTGQPAWCQACVAAAAAEHEEFHWRAEWAFGGFVVCPMHRRLLVRNCPVCRGPCGPMPDGGRLRLWCEACGRCVAAVEPGRGQSALWPYSEPAETRACCPTLDLDRRAPALLSRLQADLLRAASGRRPTGPWGMSVRPDPFLAAVRALACLALHALWEAPKVPDPLRRFGSDWSPGDEHPAVAAGALAVAASVLASVRQWPPPGAAWNAALLREGEPACVDFDTLCWHLSRDEGEALRSLSRGPLAPYRYAFDAALNGIADRRGPNREEARRRAGFGGAARSRMAKEAMHGAGTCADRAHRRRHAAARAGFASIRRQEVFRRVRVLSARDKAALGWGAASGRSAGAETAEAGAGHATADEERFRR